MLSSSRKAACVQFNWHRLKCVVTSLFVTCTGTAGALMGTFMWRKWNTDVHILMSSVAATTGSSLCPTLSPYRRCVSLFTHKHWVVQSPYSCALPWMRWSLSLSSVPPAGFPDDRWWSQEGGGWRRWAVSGRAPWRTGRRWAVRLRQCRWMCWISSSAGDTQVRLIRDLWLLYEKHGASNSGPV